MVSFYFFPFSFSFISVKPTSLFFENRLYDHLPRSIKPYLLPTFPTTCYNYLHVCLYRRTRLQCAVEPTCSGWCCKQPLFGAYRQISACRPTGWSCVVSSCTNKQLQWDQLIRTVHFFELIFSVHIQSVLFWVFYLIMYCNVYYGIFFLIFFFLKKIVGLTPIL